MLLMSGIFITTLYAYMTWFQQALNTVVKHSNLDNSTWEGRILEELGIPVNQFANKYVITDML